MWRIYFSTDPHQDIKLKETTSRFPRRIFLFSDPLSFLDHWFFSQPCHSTDHKGTRKKNEGQRRVLNWYQYAGSWVTQIIHKNYPFSFKKTIRRNFKAWNAHSHSPPSIHIPPTLQDLVQLSLSLKTPIWSDSSSSKRP